MKKKYFVEHRETLWTCTIEVEPEMPIPQLTAGHDRQNIAMDAIIAMVDFWTGAKYHLANNNGDYVLTFVQQLAREIFYILAAEKLNVIGVITTFKSREGWAPMDGSYGIKIISVDILSFDQEEFRVEEVQP
jgi:hypothetical protein